MKCAPFKLHDLRAGDDGVRTSFEELCCQIFRRAQDIPADSKFRRIRGDGGDGGVEALWTFPTGEIWGLQAKFFETLGATQKRQIAKSIMQAVANYRGLTRYTICLPINLTAQTGGKTGKSRSGQHERIAKWIEEWQAELSTGSRFVTFDIWDESELLGRMASTDTSGGLARYWFDVELLTRPWFVERLTDAKAQAGPRYSPTLAIATPLDDTFLAFGRSEPWIRKIESFAERFSETLDRWSRTVSSKDQPLDKATNEIINQAATLVATARIIEASLSSSGEDPGQLVLLTFRNAVRQSIELASALEPSFKRDLLERHGEIADTAHFRQLRAEYMADFPMAALDCLRDLSRILSQVEILAFQPEGQLPAAPAMLLRGSAGVGKTHGIIDTAHRRMASGLLSIVLFGEDVSGPEPWHSFTAKLGLAHASGNDAILDALNAAGEATGFPLLIFIDALNETEPDRRKWRNWLPPMLEQVRRRPFLKLCVSCRDIYVRDVMPKSFSYPAFEHNGFLGREYEAQFAFFQHYGVGVPAEPLLQEEFTNPLFLRLLCEALRDCKMQAIPAGREGIRALINILLLAKNDKAAAVCDFDKRENRVRDAMLRLAKAMGSSGSRTLPLVEAKNLVDDTVFIYSKSLFELLESESLIATVEKPAGIFGGEPTYSVRFPFERIGDHLIAEHLLERITDLQTAFASCGHLHFVVESSDAARAHSGILEALSIQLPELHMKELIDVVSTIDRSILWDAFIAGLQWRAPQFVSKRTEELTVEALSSNETNVAAADAILGLAARPEHPLNIHFLDKFLIQLPLLRRDPIWANIVEQSYSGWSDIVRPKSTVYRLIETASRGNLDDLDDDVGTNWAIALAWFCGSPDRRIRDRATIAMASIFNARPSTIPPLLRKFALIDDEYISERVIVAAYGALLLNESIAEIHTAACIVYELYFADGQPPLNTSLRDHARLIVEMSVQHSVAPYELNSGLYRPPYQSEWPIHFPSYSEVKPYIDDQGRFPQMNLAERIGLATGTDFARYIVELRCLNQFDIKGASLDKTGVFLWFLKKAVDLGYPGPDDECALFDRHMLKEFGGGRAKPGWAERLGKKYYWTFVRQLNGRLADHIDRKTWCTTLPPSDDLQGITLRDIDPSDLRHFLHSESENGDWLMPAAYSFPGRDDPESDATWIKQNDLTDISQALELTDADGIRWQTIEIDASWSGKRADRRARTYRHVTRSTSAITCAVADIGRVERLFSKSGLSLCHRGPHDYRGYLGEYPLRWPYQHRFDDNITFEDSDDGIMFQHLTLRQLRGREWEYDYSRASDFPSLLMPSPDLVLAGPLRWDHRGGWQDQNGILQLRDPFWSTEGPPALLCRTDYIDQFLSLKNRALIIVGLQTKFIAGMSGAEGRLTEETLFIRHRNETRFVKRKRARD